MNYKNTYIKIIYLFNLYLKQKTNLYNNYNNNLYKIRRTTLF